MAGGTRKQTKSLNISIKKQLPVDWMRIQEQRHNYRQPKTPRGLLSMEELSGKQAEPVKQNKDNIR
jgi:hypothetical protein